MPGSPVEVPSVQSLPGLLNNLYTLSYIRNNTIKTTLLLFSQNVNIGEAVEAAREYCKKQRVSFSWLEKAIVDMRT